MSSSNSVSFPIGTGADLTPLFAYQPPQVPLWEGIAHTLNQILARDLFYGAWAQVWGFSKVPKLTDVYHVTISSPNAGDDLTGYQTQIPAFLAAVQAGLELYTANNAKVEPKTPPVSFLPPFGLSMLNTRSIQLLHYPPSETLYFMDYLYSDTNRRWESLLGYNGYTGAENTLVETIVDVIPVAANGTSGSQQLEPLLSTFAPYVQQMLNVYLHPSPSGKATQPLVAYGGPVREFLEAPPFNQKDLGVGKVISLQLTTGGPSTPVLCANHPSEFLMPADPKYPAKDPQAILLDDLKSARWQSTMSQNPDADPTQTFQDASDYWDQNPDLVAQIFAEQTAEFKG